jgi:hypothetical protein
MTYGVYAQAITQEKREAQARLAKLFLPTAEEGMGTPQPGVPFRSHEAANVPISAS